MFKKFYPNEYLESAYVVDYEGYYSSGIRAVIFDVDNTLVEHDAPADAHAKELMQRLKKIGYKICFLSNNDEKRVSEFNAQVDCMYIFKAGKPSSKGYNKAMERMGTDKNTTLFVGDQIFTDIWGANNAGIKCVLVKPIAKHEEIQIILKRIPEKLILFFYRLKNKKQNKCQ